jgi:hypothetical protein
MEQETDPVAELRARIVQVEGAVSDCQKWKDNPPGGMSEQRRQDNEVELIGWKRELKNLKAQYHQLTGRHYPQ